MSAKTFSSISDLSLRLRSLLVLTVIVLSLAACKNQDASAVASTTVLPTPNTTISAPPATTTAASAQNSYADVVSRVTPAVVTVRSERRAQASAQGQGSGSPFEDQLREFFGGRVPRGLDPQQPRGRRGGGLGSGVVVTPDGYILTNNHVVEGADTVKVEMNDRRMFTAKVVGTDPPSDLAVLKIDATNLPVLPLGDSDRVRVGDVALAVGNPLGVGQTVTSGIISAKGRETSRGPGSADSFEDFIQTDAPINSGNSGGALINTTGELVGINSQILSPTGGNIGIGFAIPSNMARNVMDQIVKTGTVRRSKLGIGVQDIDADAAEAIGLKEVRGVLVGQVEPGSPAERAGIKRGDVVTALNGAPAVDRNSFRNNIANLQPNSEVTLTVFRDGREQQLRAKLVERTAEVARNNQAAPSNNPSEAAGRLGIDVQPITPEVAAQLELRPGTQGVVVRRINPDGPAAEAGIQQGDVIEEVNRQPVRSADDLRAALQRSGARPVLMLVNRGGNTNYITVRPQQS